MKNSVLSTFGIIILLSILTSSCTLRKDPKEILKRANDIGMKIYSVSFTVEDVTVFTEKSFQRQSKITAERTKSVNGIPAKYRIITSDSSEMFYCNDQFTRIDNPEKKVIRTINPIDARNLADNFTQPIFIIMKNEYTVDKILKKAKKVQYLGEAYAGGLMCDIIYIERPGMDESSTIQMQMYFAKSDGLMRKEEIKFMFDGRCIQQNRIIYSNLTVNPKLNNNTFTAKYPSNYNIEDYQPPKQEEQPEPLKTGDLAPGFELKDGTGNIVKLSDQQGKITVIDFWGTWCIWCVPVMPKMQKLYDEFSAKGVEFYGISCREQKDAHPVKFLKDKGFTYKVLLNGDETAKDYHVTGYPTIYIIGKDSKIKYVELGYNPDFDKKAAEIIKEEIKK